ncbi:hypothetical protein, partial [Thiorhodococcus drewsii]
MATYRTFAGSEKKHSRQTQRRIRPDAGWRLTSAELSDLLASIISETTAPGAEQTRLILAGAPGALVGMGADGVWSRLGDRLRETTER